MPQLPKMVQALLEPRIYPDASLKVKLVQTQMSFVFLTDDYVYKVKKPVNLGYLDYTTLEKRYFYCQREVELNQRLCPDTYLGVVSITEEGKGFAIEGKGKVVDYAVKMLRLPQEGMLKGLLTKGQVSVEMIGRVAQKLADFHQKAETNADISTFGGLEAIITNSEENFNQTEKYIGNTISQNSYWHIKDYTYSFIERNAPLFRKRIADGKIRDCHGDLHAAHICFTNPPAKAPACQSSAGRWRAGGICIFDCIEFNERFRYCDVASEIAFLAMDLDNCGRAGLSQIFVDAYAAFSQDKELTQLLDFYKCYRAYVRGKVESFKLDDFHISEKEKKKALVAARKYFQLASSYLI